MLDPGEEFRALLRRHARRLMRKVRGNIAIGQHDRTSIERRHNSGFSLKAIAGVKKCRKMRIHFVERAQLTVQKLPDHFAEPGLVLREARAVYGIPARS